MEMVVKYVFWKNILRSIFGSEVKPGNVYKLDNCVTSFKDPFCEDSPFVQVTRVENGWVRYFDLMEESSNDDNYYHVPVRWFKMNYAVVSEMK